ncbi:WAT1-related protein [Apostasia shenzhenica]|uniref:WAT1-related protein n=1 Tax=Apostasia shenzhenica TaxID=1088818 RepID=A0A2I0AKQ6_9ASPA|nr:WAT1-related protein [Apostasia shenzhenica]
MSMTTSGDGIGGRKVLQKVKPYVALVLIQFGFGTMYVITEATLKRGVNHYVLVVYRNAIAAAVMAPFAIWFERKTIPKITMVIFLKIVGLSILEPVFDQNFYYMGSKLTSASFAAALYNILPALTFILALFLRIEKLDIRRRQGQAKVIGTLVTVAGTALIILYKGPTVEFFGSKNRAHRGTSAVDFSKSQTVDWLKGTFTLLLSCLSWSFYLILQSNTLRSLPAELSVTTLMCTVGAAMNAVIALVMERGSMINPWIIGWDMRLFTAIYSGVICTGVAYYVCGMVIREKGPVFVTAFNPLCMIITAFMGSIILGEELTLGRIIGATIIVVGLYFLIWGKSKDYRTSSNIKDIDSQKLPTFACINEGSTHDGTSDASVSVHKISITKNLCPST